MLKVAVANVKKAKQIVKLAKAEKATFALL